MWPFKKKVSVPVEKGARWKIEKETANFIQIALIDEGASIQILEELLNAGFEFLHSEYNLNFDRVRFICRKTMNADFSKLLQY